MKGWGIALIVLGALIALGSLAMDTTVYTPVVSSIVGYGGVDASRTHNLGQLQMQELFFIGGCTLFLAGAVLAGAGQIEAALGGFNGGRGRVSAAPEETLEEREARMAAANAAYNRLLIAGGIALALAFAVAWLVGSQTSPEAAAVENEAAAMANALDGATDNMPAIAEPRR